MSKEYKENYAAHVAEMQSRWANALDAENLEAVLVHSGTPLISFQDDYEYAFRPNPHFMAWLPLTHHHDSALLVRPGKKPCIFYYQPEDFWYLAPEDPESWWADHFDIQLVSEADGWRSGLFSKLNGLSSGLRNVAAVGDAPSLAVTFEDDRINPGGLVNRLNVARTYKTPYEIACMREASQLAARAHVEAESAFREGDSEFRIHQRYLNACEHTDSQLPYNNIVALNTHGSVLHYQGRDVDVPDRIRSFLIDAGCTVNAYASDITRTYIAQDIASQQDGFEELVTAMDTMQQGLSKAVRPGLDYRQLHLQAHLEIAPQVDNSCRWYEYFQAQEILNKLVQAEPRNQAAKDLLADVFEQIGYQQENPGLRNSFLNGAFELRSGIPLGASPKSSGPDVVRAMSTELFLDFLGIMMDAREAEDMEFTINLVTPDNGEKFAIELSSATLTNIEGFLAGGANGALVSITCWPAL